MLVSGARRREDSCTNAALRRRVLGLDQSASSGIWRDTMASASPMPPFIAPCAATGSSDPRIGSVGGPCTPTATRSKCRGTTCKWWGRHLNGSLRIETTGSRSSIEKPGPGSRHLHAGHRLGSLQGNPPDFSRRYHPPSVSMSCTGSRRVNGGSLAFVFLIHTCRVMLDVSPTLTTATLNDSRLGWFEAGS